MMKHDIQSERFRIKDDPHILVRFAQQVAKREEDAFIKIIPVTPLSLHPHVALK